MKRITFGKSVIWDTLLVLSVIFAAFILPVVPLAWQRSAFMAVYTIIYITAIISLESRSNYTILLFVVTVLLAWISNLLTLEIMTIISKGVNIIYFLVIVYLLIKQIALAREVTSGIILSSIAGYLLMGIIVSIFIAFLMQQDPAAFTPVHAGESGPDEALNVSGPLYFSFVTMASLGYGDVLPLKPYTRSLATFIVISGQFYIAIIVALLVGKFSARQSMKKDD
ncbi:MAG: hypothetical protein HGA23_00415 [Bacteroidales bacterium]|nr:hypothetical protein [Bacteroidales bacterium]